MTRSILSGLLALFSVGVLSIVPVACQSGGVGDPCTPEDEYQPDFAGFELDLSNIESRSFQCTTRVCLVNHFQGRVSCPLGQDGTKLTACNPKATPTGCTGTGQQCVLSQVFAPSCGTCDGTDPTCATLCPPVLDTNNKQVLVCTNGSCVCDPTTTAATTPVAINEVGYLCQAYNPTGGGGPNVTVLQSFQCHVPGSCQLADNSTSSDTANVAMNLVTGAATPTPKDCCVPGTDTPVNTTVCGQCGSASKRDANHAVYCSCRCCAPCCPTGTTAANAITMGCSTDMSTCGSACDPNFDYCSCPSGFTCSDIRAFVGLGDQELAGAYCIQQGTDYSATDTCGVNSDGYNASPCQQ
jgi:hypothetical protein